MTPEGVVKKQVRALLGAFNNVEYDMPVQNGMGKPMLDFHCCVAGRYLAIETKRAGGKPTPRQVVKIAAVRAAGGTVMVIDGPSGLAELELWLHANTSRKTTGRAASAQPADGTEHDTDG